MQLEFSLWLYGKRHCNAPLIFNQSRHCFALRKVSLKSLPAIALKSGPRLCYVSLRDPKREFGFVFGNRADGMKREMRRQVICFLFVPVFCAITAALANAADVKVYAFHAG